MSVLSDWPSPQFTFDIGAISFQIKFFLKQLNFLYLSFIHFKFFLQIDVPYVEDTVAISQYPLSGALTCAKICTAFEEAWGVV